MRCRRPCAAAPWRSACSARSELPLSEFLGEADEDSFGAADVAEPIHVLVLHDVTDQLRAMLAQPRERVVDVVHGEHDAEVAEGVDRRGMVIGPTAFAAPVAHQQAEIEQTGLQRHERDDQFRRIAERRVQQTADSRS